MPQRGVSVCTDSLRCTAVGFCLALLLVQQSRGAQAALCYRSFTKTAFPNCQLLSPTYALHWSISGTTISYGVDVDGSVGWLGLGISDGGGMSGADIIVVQTLDSGHTWTAQDYFVDGEMRPSLDGMLGGTQDVTMLTSVVRTANHTAAAFKRPLESCDPWDWPIVEDVFQTVIWAFGTGQFAYHGAVNRGSASLKLQPLPGALPPGPDPSDLKPLMLQLPMPFTIPTNSVTTYICANLELPTDAKYQAIRYDSLINSSLVHHQVLYSCSAKPVHPVGQLFECQHQMEPSCAAFYMIAAPGVGTTFMPPEAALPFGKGSVQYATLQIHYTNPLALAGQVDQSGFVAYITQQLRPNDMGVLTLGTNSLTLPPGQASVVSVPNACPGACTRRLQAPLNIYSSFLHMHQLGHAISTRLIRNGQELPAVGYKNYYDYDAQGSTGAPLTSRTLMAGDTLITTCSFDTRSATAVTKFGTASSDEMCFNFLMYWPSLPDLDTCMTFGSVGGMLVPVASCAASSDLKTANHTVADFLASGQFVVSAPVAYVPYVSKCGLSATRTKVAPNPSATAPAPGRTLNGLPPPSAPATPPGPNTKGAISAIVVITIVCSLTGWALWYRFGRPQDLRDALLELEQARLLPSQA